MDSYRILGTLLNVDLNFDDHFLAALKSAYEGLRLVKLFTINQKQPRESTITHLYKTLILKKVDFSTAACVNISSNALNKLQTLQKDCLIAATQCKTHTSIEVLNMITNTLPIDLHLKKKAAEDLCRISSRDSDVINSQFEAWWEWINNGGTEKYSSSFRKMMMDYTQITKEEFLAPERVSLFRTEVNPFVSMDIMIEREDTPELQLVQVTNLINSNSYDFIIGTDGSSFPRNGSKLGNTGAAAIVMRKTENHVEKLSLPVSHMSNNYEAELVGINLGLSYLVENRITDSSVLFLCDCIPAMTMSFGSTKYIKDYNQLINDNKLQLLKLLKNNNNVKSTWVPGHHDVKINEEADSEAKAAAQLCRPESSNTPDRKNLLMNLREKVV